MGDAVTNNNLCLADNILHVFLYGSHGKNPGYGGESEEIRRVCTGDKTGTAYSRLYRSRFNAVDIGREYLFIVHSGIAEFNSGSDAHTGRLFRRHGVINRSKCSVAHDETN